MKISFEINKAYKYIWWGIIEEYNTSVCQTPSYIIMIKWIFFKIIIMFVQGFSLNMFIWKFLKCISLEGGLNLEWKFLLILMGEWGIFFFVLFLMYKINFRVFVFLCLFINWNWSVPAIQNIDCWKLYKWDAFEYTLYNTISNKILNNFSIYTILPA